MKADLAAALPVVLLAITAVCAQQFSLGNKYIESVQGELPLILEVPHDGTLDIPGIPVKKIKSGERDTNASKLASIIADNIFKATGKKPYVVIMKVKRDYIDANRPPDGEAFDNKITEDLYYEYYSTIEHAISGLHKTYKTGLLIDIHCGSGKDFIHDLYFGTNHGRTYKNFLEYYSEDDFTGENSISYQMAEKGYEVPGYKNVSPDYGWSGNIIQNFGQKNNFGIDAIEIEVQRVRFMHKTASLNKLGKDMADSIMVFLNRYYVIQ